VAPMTPADLATPMRSPIQRRGMRSPVKAGSEDGDEHRVLIRPGEAPVA
jgi:hypothetical protein